MKLHLPFPPSLNNMFPGNGNRRIRSAEYAKWANNAGWLLKAQRATKIAGPVAVELQFVNPPGGHLRDVDNLIKPVLDLLVTHEIIQGDDVRYVRRVSAEWVDAGEPCTVRVWPLSNPLTTDMDERSE